MEREQETGIIQKPKEETEKKGMVNSIQCQRVKTSGKYRKRPIGCSDPEGTRVKNCLCGDGEDKMVTVM